MTISKVIQSKWGADILKVQCLKCYAIREYPDEYVGRQAKCLNCKQEITLVATVTATLATKPCPFCAEKIHINAIKCKHCGEFLNGAIQRPNTRIISGSSNPASWPNIRLIASRQRFFIRAFLASVLLEFPLFLLLLFVVFLAEMGAEADAEAFSCLLCLFCLLLVVFRFAITLNLCLVTYRDKTIGVFVSLLTFVPVLVYLAVLFINIGAISVLKRNGIKVGFMGVDSIRMFDREPKLKSQSPSTKPDVPPGSRLAKPLSRRDTEAIFDDAINEALGKHKTDT